MAEFVEVRFKGNRRECFLWDKAEPLVPGDEVLVELERGCDLGCVSAVGNTAAQKSGIECAEEPDTGQKRCSHKILRPASANDAHLLRELRKAEEEVRLTVIERAAKHDLTMKVSDAEWQWDRKKLTVYFTAEARVDFRALVRDLASLFRTRIELRQIGARDEARRLDGIGRCGRRFCCASWLCDLKPVSLALAKDQRLSLNPSQISGGCGRLLCCLRYEHDFYSTSRKRFPKEGRTLRTAIGSETVVAVDILRDRVLLRDDDGSTRVVSLPELKSEVGSVEAKPEPPEAAPASAHVAFDEGNRSVATAEPAEPAAPVKHRRGRRRGRRRRRSSRTNKNGTSNDKSSAEPERGRGG